MNHANRYARLATLALAALVGAVAAHGIGWSLGQLGWVDRALVGSDQVHLSSLAGLVVGAAAASIALALPAYRRWSVEVVEELLRVNWPTRPEVVRATWVVLCAVAICSVYLGALDALWLWLTNTLLGVRANETMAAIGPVEALAQWGDRSIG